MKENRINIFGSHISITNLDETLCYLKNYDFLTPHYICFPNVYVTMLCYDNPKFQQIINSSCMSLPDGKPLELYARIKGNRSMSTVSGFWLIKALLKTDFTHYFYGSNEETLELLKREMDSNFPKANILGFKSPPFVDLQSIVNNSIINNDIVNINKLKPDFIWVGLSSPKQDMLMKYFYPKLDHGLMMGVGAVFNYLSGSVQISPEWMKKLSLRWVYRLYKEPRRLWKKYIFGNSLFIFLVVTELIKRLTKLNRR